MSRVRRSLLLTALLTALGVGVAASPAQAADELLLSMDGAIWSTALPSDLFDDPVALVPGDVITTALWVHNASGDRARVELDVADALGDLPGTLAGDLSLTIDGADVAGGERWRGPVLAPGAMLEIPLEITFDAVSPGSSMRDVSWVLDAAMLVQTDAGPGPADDGSRCVAGPAASTASSAGPSAGSVAPSLGGLAHTGARRRRRARRSPRGGRRRRAAPRRPTPLPPRARLTASAPARSAARSAVREARAGEQWASRHRVPGRQPADHAAFFTRS